MEIIPAIDIRGGQCVRLLQGDYEHETVYGADPVAMAQRWVNDGAPRLHVVDLDGAREGAPANLEIIGRIAQSVPVPVQLGGGLRSAQAIERALEAGVQRCIIGTQAVQRPEWAQQMFAQFGDAIILGLDARDGFVATAGWQDTSQVPAVTFAQTMQGMGCHRIIFTDIARDGTLSGPNATALRAIAEAVEIPVIASGGVHKATDIRILRNIPNVEGAIVGKALYEGTTTVQELIDISRERE
ncbi:MAG: 1-(5-phosphoribosyl)-5-[(5-phosphoribosylamino)methylideneamino]imidazole-4-carboxamide isomerase [Abitibacteriaceae bacterium]|nr:1-(5-phosphoribosyl)-5-[(5-phosphoribosylamino)methylideneamino]imidazole-4-carboxamide isomerase [Abditibacteriaceae bacterium]